MFGLYSYGPFGIYKHVDKSSIPEMYFNISAKRHLIDTFIADLLPILVMAILLFIILLTSLQQSYGVFGTTASVFFGLVFAQYRFRLKIPSYELVYFENFYFLLYAAIIAIIIVSVLFLLPTINLWSIQYKNNLIAKLLYWPLLLGSALAITLYYL